ncbi:uncharacterized protein [Dermacentor andersoni]|uniref:uncharacterized protein n=1 Tax=Dermacentor andersoni TaxID=34620 RepID=UPI003B3A9FE7
MRLVTYGHDGNTTALAAESPQQEREKDRQGDHLTSTVTSTETSWHPDKSSSLFDVPFSGLGSTERARMLIKFFLIAQRPSRASEKSLRYWREQTAGQVRMAMHLGEQDSNCESLVVSQNFVLCQDGLTPCHLMLSLSGQLFARTWCYAAFSC